MFHDTRYHRFNPKAWPVDALFAGIRREDAGNGWTRTSHDGFEQMFREGDDNDYYLEKFDHGRRRAWTLVRRRFDDSTRYPPKIAGPFPDETSARAAYDLVSKTRGR